METVITVNRTSTNINEKWRKIQDAIVILGQEILKHNRQIAKIFLVSWRREGNRKETMHSGIKYLQE